MPEALDQLRHEHREMCAVLDALGWQVKQFDRMRQPDYELIVAALDWFLAFPDRHHHPREELIFARLQQRDPAAAYEVGSLTERHRELAERAHDYAAGLEAVLQDAEVSRSALAEWAHRFIELQRQHMAMEEARFFPAAARALAAADWSDLAAKMAADGMPLGIGAADEKDAALRRKILSWQAEDRAAERA